MAKFNTQQLQFILENRTATLQEVQQSNPEIAKAVRVEAHRVARRVLTKKLARNSLPIREAASKLKLQRLGREPTGKDVKAALVESLQQASASEELIQEAKSALGDLQRIKSPEDIAPLNMPLEVSPAFQRPLATARLVELGRRAQIPNTQLEVIAKNELTELDLSDDKLREMVSQQLIDEPAAKRLGLTVSLHRMLDERTELVDAVLRDTLANGGTLRSLAAKDSAAWTRAIEENNAPVPEGLQKDEYGSIIARRFAAAFPSEALVGRRAIDLPRQIQEDIEGLAPLLSNQPTILTDRNAEPDLESIPAVDRNRIQEAYDRSKTLVGSYPGLPLAAILEDVATPVADRVEKVKTEITQFKSVQAANPDTNWLSLDYSPDSDDIPKINFAGVDERAQRKFVANMKSYQRAYQFAGSVEDAGVVLAAGYQCSKQVVADGFDKFAAKSKLPGKSAERVYEAAKVTVGSVAATFGSILDLLRGHFGSLLVGNSGPQIADLFAKMDGFSDLFGSQDFCDCQHCNSILGPAAYFVDLMMFVEQHVLDKAFTGPLRNHFLNLKSRRPDLWTLELTCANSVTEIPQLVIVNELLNRYIASRRAFIGDLDDKQAVERFVAKNLLPDTTNSFSQPYFLPLDIAEVYLSHFEIRRAGIASHMGLAADVVTRANLSLSPRQSELIFTANLNVSFLENVYGIDFQPQGAVFKAVEVKTLLRAMKMDRKQFGDLANSKFVNSGSTAIKIRSEKRSPESVQNDVEMVANLTAATLDQMHRMARLWKKLATDPVFRSGEQQSGLTGRGGRPWSVRELDLVLLHLKRAGLTSGLDSSTARPLADVINLQERCRLSVEETVGLWSDVPTDSVTAERESLFDVLFNTGEFTLIDGDYPKATFDYIHPAHREADASGEEDVNTHRLRAALRLSSEQLASLIRNVASALQIDFSTTAADDRKFKLTAANLATLFRHARLGRLLKLSPDELFQAIALCPSIANPHVESLDDVIALIKFHDRLEKLKLDRDDVALATGGAALKATPKDAAAIADAVLTAVEAEGVNVFAASLFAELPAVDEAASRSIVAANPGIFAPVGDGTFRLTSTYGPAVTIVVPAGISATDADIRPILEIRTPGALLRNSLAQALSISDERTDAFFDLVGSNLHTPQMARIVLREDPVTALVGALAAVLRLLNVMKDDLFTPETIQELLAQGQFVSASDWTQLSSEAVVRLAVYRQMLEAASSQDHPAAALTTILNGHTTAGGFSAGHVPNVAQALGLQEALVATLITHGTFTGPAPLLALQKLEAAADLAEKLGLDGLAMKQLASETYDSLTSGSEAAFAAMRAQYPDEKEWEETHAPFAGAVLNRKRDALLDFAVFSLKPEFENASDVYEYFLIDPLVDACFQTSRVVAATNSVQLYVHRVLMNQERDRAGTLEVTPDLIDRDEWEWRKLYRVWEANRKIFLWPENWIIPDLRDNKTPLFEELQSSLLQREITEQSALDAYGAYMQGFEELANLKIAGVYHDINQESQTDVLYMFGVASGDPPTYYFRTVENYYFGNREDSNRGAVWSPWRKMDVRINTERVAPVIYHGRLFVFWIDSTALPVNSVSDGMSRFVGYSHKWNLQFTSLRLDGRWDPPQQVSLYGVRPFYESNGVLDDPLVDEKDEEWKDFTDALKDWFPWGAFGNREKAQKLGDAHKRLLIPRYDTEIHTKPRDGYKLTGFPWNQVYPDPTPDGLWLYGVGHEMHVSADLFEKSVKQLTGVCLNGNQQRINVGLFWAPRHFLCAKTGSLYRGTPQALTLFPAYAFCETVIEKSRIDRIINWPDREWDEAAAEMFSDTLYGKKIATLNGDAQFMCINGSLGDTIATINGDQLILRQSINDGEYYVAERLGTTIAETVARALFTRGVDGMLDIETQKAIKEATAPVTFEGDEVVNRIKSGQIDFEGPYGVYYREIFFHTPFLIAHHLNSQKKFAESQRWYHYIFDPTATEVIPDDPTLSDAANELRKRDRNWRYIEFRDRSVPSLRSILTDSGTIEAYRRDPFNPHAIARLRLSAYQKSVVMNYVDNLLDWADDLFTQFQRETVNEALMLYITAANILGPRPTTAGDCGEGKVKPKNFEKIKPLVEEGSEFLAELESWISAPKYTGPGKGRGKFVLDNPTIKEVNKKVAWEVEHLNPVLRDITVSLEKEQDPRARFETGVKTWNQQNRNVVDGELGVARSGLFLDPQTVAEAPELREDRGIRRGTTSDPMTLTGEAAVAAGFGTTILVDDGVPPSRRTFADVPMSPTVGKGRLGQTTDQLYYDHPSKSFDWKSDKHAGATGAEVLPGRTISPYLSNPKFGPAHGWAFIRQISPVFCVPGNKYLLDYWDRVEDRLYKLRNCLDITGARRDLSLFSPEIDPGMLVRAAAAGLSIGDIFGGDAGNAPAFRFAVLLDRAKAAAAVAQSFSAALQAAIERKDAEELTLLRQQHQSNVLNMTSKTRDWEIEVAEQTLESLELRKQGLENRLAHYNGLISEGLVPWERAQQISKHAANVRRAGEAATVFLAGIMHAIPQFGSPFAMKYGGKELGDVSHRVGVGLRTLTTLADQIASSAGLEAGFQRRHQGWEHQAQTIEDQLKEMEKQIEAAEIRKDIAARARELHELAIEQNQEVEDYYADRFSNFGLYEWMSTQLQRISRDAYNTALSLARLAERSYRFEHDEETATFIGGSYWDAGRAGLLGASQLTNALLQMEQRHVETRQQRQEVDIAFSLSQLDPAALLELKQTGQCEFDLDELFYDLFYRGQYHRKIRSVRLTIPCVAGPYTNVSAQLELLGSFIRTVPQTGDDKVVEAPRARANEIVTSTAQNDAGVFDLNFSGANYMPFEGAGAISRWRLTLPKSLRQFDYATINDIVVHVAYTARFDGVYRDAVEQAAGTLDSRLASASLVRTFSLRQEFSSTFNQLQVSPVGTDIALQLTDKHFPIYVQGKTINLTGAKLLVVANDDQTLGTLKLSVNGSEFDTFNPDATLGDIRAADLGSGFAPAARQTHVLKVVDAGDLAVTAPNAGALDPEKIKDLILLLEYSVS